MVAVLLMNRIPWIVVVRWKLCDPRCAAYQSGMRRSGLTHAGSDIPRRPDSPVTVTQQLQHEYSTSDVFLVAPYSRRMTLTTCITQLTQLLCLTSLIWYNRRLHTCLTLHMASSRARTSKLNNAKLRQYFLHATAKRNKSI